MNNGIARRRARGKHRPDGHLALVPFIDMLTILVVFLLLHTSDVEILPNTQNIRIPESVSDLKPRETLVVMVTREHVYVNGTPVATIAEVEASRENVVKPLREALLARSGGVLRTEAAEAARQEVTIMGDRDTPYAVLKKVMATCTDAEFSKASLAVLERELNA